MKGLIFTYLLTYGGALASLFNPYIGLLVYVCFSIISRESLWYWSVPEGNYSRIVAIALLVGWALRGFGNWQFGRGGTIVGLFIGFWVWAVLSATQAAAPEACLVWIEATAKILLPFVVGMTLIDSVAKLKQLAWVIVLSHGYVAYDLNMAYYGGFNRIQEIGFGGMDNNCVAITMVLCTGLAFFLGLTAPRWWQKGIAFGSTALMVHCVLFAFSRGGMLGLIIMGAISFVLIPKKPRHYLTFALIVLLALRLAGPEVVKRFGSAFAEGKTRDKSAQSRVIMWKACVKVMIEKPLFGVGPGSFSSVIHLYTPYGKGKEAHTLWLQIGAETGAVGLFLLVSFYGVCVVRLWPLTRESHPVADPWFRHTARMVIASLTGFIVSAQFVSLPGLEVPYYVVLLGAGASKLTSLQAPTAASLPATWTPTPALARLDGLISNTLRRRESVPSNQQPQEIDALTGFRWLAASLVFMYHVQGASHDVPRGAEFLTVIGRAGWCGVPMFFALSGFLLMLLYYRRFQGGLRNLRPYVIKRITRIYPLYYVLLAAVVVQISISRKSLPDLVNVTVHLGMLQSFFGEFSCSYISSAWSLTVEECFYFLMPLVCLLIGRFGESRKNGLSLKRTAALLFVLNTLLLGVGLLVSRVSYKPYGFFHQWRHDTIFGQFLHFSFGIFAAAIMLKYPDTPLRINRLWSNLLGFAGVILLILAAYMDTGVLNGKSLLGIFWFPAVEYLFGIASAFFILSLCTRSCFATVLSWRPLVYGGKISYAFYLVHTMYTFYNGVSYRYAVLQNPWLAYLAFGLLSAVLYEVIEKPAQRWLRNKWIPAKEDAGKARQQKSAAAIALCSAE